MDTMITCIVCPQGCTIAAVVEDGEVKVWGNRCNRGKVYAQEEILHPQRTLTTTVKVRGGIYPLVPAKSQRPIPKERLWQALEEIMGVEVEVPIESGQVLVKDLAGTGVALVATRGMGREKENEGKHCNQ